MQRRDALSAFAVIAARVVVPVALPVALTGCGFTLQGSSTTLPFERFHTTIPANTAVGGDLRRAVRASGAEVLERPEQAQVVLRLLAEAEERDIGAFSTTGRPREYVLRLRMQLRITDGAGRSLVPDAEIALRRRLAVSDALGTYNADEAALLYRDMRNDLVQQLMRRLASLKLPPPK
jgi:LPS-assembly lipoprotein